MLNQREKEQIKSYFTKEKSNNLFLLSPSDIGVIRNQGRRGARYAPEAIINCFKKMTIYKDKEKYFKEFVVSNYKLEEKNFDCGQELEIENITQAIKNGHKNIIHIGGGHDHIYCLLKAIAKGEPIHIINLDAHLDTRIDKKSHSGTPFRQFYKEFKNMRLTQIGINHFSNSYKNYTNINNMKVITMKQLKEGSFNFSKIENFLKEEVTISKDDITILSLDCDGICSSIMEAVSAVSHYGIPPHTIIDIFNFYKKHSNNSIVGIYEYNPIYDNLSQKGARFLAGIIYQVIF